MAGDNPHFQVSGKGLEQLRLVVEMAYKLLDVRAIEAYANKSNRLVFFHYKQHPESVPVEYGKPERVPVLPLPSAGPELLTHLIHTWLSNTASWPPEPDHDGDNGRGFLVYLGDDDCASFVVKPFWEAYGK